MDNGFSGKLDISMLPGQSGENWILEHWLSYTAFNGVVYTVKEGFSTDGASIPRLFWRVIGCPLRGPYAPAAVIHDALYWTKLGSRKEADDLLLEMMERLPVGDIRSNLMYSAVRVGGWKPWNGRPDMSQAAVSEFLEVSR